VHIPAIDEGASWTFSSPPPTSSWPNHGSATANAADIHKQLGTLADEGLIEWFGPINEFVRNINPFGAVSKPDGSLRILMDPSITGVNDHMLKLPLTLPTVREALLLTSPTSILGKRDLNFKQRFIITSPFKLLLDHTWVSEETSSREKKKLKEDRAI
jgi:hypothetical protein